MPLTSNIVIIGDSIPAATHVGPGEGYFELSIAALQAAGYTISPHNIAVPSSALDDANQAAAAAALFDPSKQRNICFIASGANDGLSKTIGQFRTALATAATTVRNAGFQPVPCTMPPCGSYDSVNFRAGINADTKTDYSRWVVDFGDPTSIMGAETAKNDTSLYSDSVHPTALGNTYMAPLLTAMIKTLTDSGFAGLRLLKVA